MATTYGVKNPYLLHLLQQSNQPVKAHSQGWSNMAHALLAGLEQGRMDRLDAETMKTAAADKAFQRNLDLAKFGLQRDEFGLKRDQVQNEQAAVGRAADILSGGAGPTSAMPQTSGPQEPPASPQWSMADVVSAVPQTGPNAGADIAPGMHADAAGAPAPKPTQMAQAQLPPIIRQLLSDPNPSVKKRGIEEAAKYRESIQKESVDLRKEVQGLPSYKNLAAAAPVYKSMAESVGRDNRAADVNMIYGLAKIMDPGSVVRESEMTIAQAVSTLPQQLQSTILSQMEGKGRLSLDVRNAILAEAFSRVQAYEGAFNQDMQMTRGIVGRRGMNEADVIPTFGPFQGPKPAEGKEPTIQELEQELRRRLGR
jgi:hypothetical protein